MNIKRMSTLALVSLLSVVTTQVFCCDDVKSLFGLVKSDTVSKIQNTLQPDIASNVPFDAHANEIANNFSTNATTNVIHNTTSEGSKNILVKFVTTHPKTTLTLLGVGVLFTAGAVWYSNEKSKNEQKSKEIFEEFKKEADEIVTSREQVHRTVHYALGNLNRDIINTNHRFERSEQNVEKTEEKVMQFLDNAEVTVNNMTTILKTFDNIQVTSNKLDNKYEKTTEALHTDDDVNALIKQSQENNAENETILKRIQDRFNKNRKK